MSKIPYFFETPVPRYFRETGWLDPNNKMFFKNLAFLTWSFSRCSKESQVVILESKQIILEPFEFVCGREKNSIECGLTPDMFRTQLKTYQNAGLLKKTPNSLPNHYSCYIWLTERFLKPDTQPNAQPGPNQPPTSPHKQETRITELKKTTGGAVSFLIESLDLTIDEKKSLSSKNFSDDRIILAIDYFKIVPPRKDLISGIIWHCKEPTPPIASKKSSIQSEKMKLIVDFQKWLKENGHKNIAEVNEREIPNGVMHIPSLVGMTQISLNSPVEILKLDFKQSKEERKLRSDQKIIQIS